MSDASAPLARRAFLNMAVGLLTATWATDWFVRRWRGASNTWGTLPFAALAGLAPGEAKDVPFSEHGRTALVVRLDSATYVAFDRRCPHLGCPVLWSATRSRFECPCHRAAFDARSGAVLFGPPTRGLEPIAIASRPEDVT